MPQAYKLIDWYQKNKRDLPWRLTKDPYKIWISEIILQQTRVEQGLNYYLRFLELFPNVTALACASDDEVLKCWQGLGYYSRARNLHFSAKFIVNELNGVFPADYEQLKKLKGVGDYTAAAIASFAYNERVAVVDGNVYRFLSRLYAESTPVDSVRGKKRFLDLAYDFMQDAGPSVFNQAIMEFGALHCKPANPDCNSCIFQTSCSAFATENVAAFPVKTKITKVRKRYFNYLYINWKGNVLLRKREENDIWKGLFEFPLIETNSNQSINKLIQTEEWTILFENLPLTIRNSSSTIKHQLSHQQLLVNFHHLEINEQITLNNNLKNYLKIPILEIKKYPVPKLLDNYLQKKVIG